MSYIINGPTIIGDSTNGNTLQGTLTLPQVCTATGDLIYSSNAGGLMTRIPIGTAGQVLTVVAGVPAWANDTNAIDNGFSAALTANQVVAAASATTPVNIAGFTVTAPGFDTTGGWFASGQAAGTWTPGTAGKYRVDVTVSFTNTDGTNASNAGTRTITLLAGGATYITKAFQPTGAAASEQQVSFSTDIVLTAVQTIAVQIVSSTVAGGMTVTTQGTIFSITRYV